MAFHFPKTVYGQMTDLERIQLISARTSDFWSKAHGWAPKEAADLLSKSRLDWLDSFNRTLPARVQEVTEHADEPAVLILAWAHLRTLVEGHLKLFLAIFLMDYLKDPHAPLKDQKKPEKGPKIPDTLSYEAIRQFIGKKGLLASHHAFIDTVQQRGNAIHAFADRPIGTTAEYLDHVMLYREFLESVESSLPNPYTHPV